MSALMSEVERRFWERVSKTDSCWLWVSELKFGYGIFYQGAGLGRVRAHRFAYEALVGPIPDGLVLDHLCRVRRCVNPAHLEPVTNKENILRGESRAAHHARQTHCKRDHEFTPDNTYVTPKGFRVCRTCHRLKMQARRAQGRAA